LKQENEDPLSIYLTDSPIKVEDDREDWGKYEE